jgi:hypothetical protein
MQRCLIDNDTSYIYTADTIFGINGDGAFIESLKSAGKMLEFDTAISSVTLVTGHEITRG